MPNPSPALPSREAWSLSLPGLYLGPEIGCARPIAQTPIYPRARLPRAHGTEDPLHSPFLRDRTAPAAASGARGWISSPRGSSRLRREPIAAPAQSTPGSLLGESQPESAHALSLRRGAGLRRTRPPARAAFAFISILSYMGLGCSTTPPGRVPACRGAVSF